MINDSQLKSEFSNTGFRSIYSCAILGESLGYTFYGNDKEFNTIIESVKNNPDGRYCFPCFGRFQNVVKQTSLVYNEQNLDSCVISKNIELYVVINTDKSMCRNYCQYCWMTVEELINHINIVKSLFDGFEFSVIKDSNTNFMKVKFLFKKGQITLFKIRFLLTWMRYSYEWAISMATMDAYRILRNPEYLPMLSKENIFNLVEITNKLVYPYVLSDQVICRKGIPMAFSSFKKNVNKEENFSLNEHIYTVNHRVNSLDDFLHLSADSGDNKRYAEINWKVYTSIAWWEDEDTFAQVRIPLYQKILETFKNQYNYEPTK